MTTVAPDSPLIELDNSSLFTSQAWFRPELPLPNHIHCLSSLRLGGVSVAPYYTNNLAYHVNDNPEHVRLNRASIPTHHPIAWLEQIHSDKVIKADLAIATQAEHVFTNSQPTPQSIIQADAVWSDSPQQVCAVMTADCLPVILIDVKHNRIAAIHCGWRGIAQQLITKTLIEMNTSVADVIAWFGPAIGPQQFEVGHDVFNTFYSLSPDTKAAFVQTGQEKYLADIYQLAFIELAELGVNRIFANKLCTVSNPDLFFSYRREGVTGRMASIIWFE